jgi:DNA ligase-1
MPWQRSALARELAVSPDGLPLLLARDAHDEVDPRGYLVSEKLDGIRARWDGRQLRFRGGETIVTPARFAAAWPAEPLDGELWAGRGGFEALSAAVRDQRPDPRAWASVRFHAFELPAAGGRFDERAAALARLASQARRKGASTLVAVEQRWVADRAALQRWLDEVVAAGGEGLMLHRADAASLHGRHDALLKLRPWLDDEGVVVAHVPGRGRHTGRLGALKLRLADGRSFLLGTGFSDAERASPPPLGSVVTFRFRGRTARGLPRFASFWRRREPGVAPRLG